MSSLTIKGFKGLIPRTSKELLPEQVAQTAQNCDLRSGELRPLKATLFQNTPTKAGTKTSIYLYADTYFFHWTTTVHVARGPLANDTAETTYFTGDGSPKMTDNTIATSGGTNYPENSFLLGIPSPTSEISIGTSNITAISGTITDVKFSSTSAFAPKNRGPIKITSTAHGLANGIVIEITEVVGTTQINDKNYTVKVLDDDTFALDETYGEQFESQVYISGGVWERVYDLAEADSRVYVYTYVSTRGEEGPPSAASEIIDVADGYEVNLTGMLTGPGGNYDLVSKNIYRSNTGNIGTELELVANIPLATTTYDDSVPREELGLVLESVGWEPPPSDMIGLLALPNGVMVGHTETEVLFSIPYKPHAYPIAYRHSSPHPIVGIGHFGTTVVVLTTNTIHVAQGYDPQSTTLEDTEVKQSCVSARSIVNMDIGVVFASPDGLISVSTSGSRIVTEKFLTKKDWDEYYPSTMTACLHDQQYFGWYDTGLETKGFVFDPANPDIGFIAIDTYATACYKNTKDDEMYLQVGSDIVKWEGHASGLQTYDWKSGESKIPYPMNFGYARVKASSYPVTIKIYGDEVLRYTKTVLNNEVFPLPAGYLAEYWQVKLTGSVDVQAVWLAESIDDMKQLT